MKTITGNLIKEFKNGTFNVILHGCNCFHVMGGGIAWAISNNFPEALEVDKKTPKGVDSKMGTISVASIGKASKSIYGQYIVNCYTQFRPGEEEPSYLYAAIRLCMKNVYDRFQGQKGIKIGYPKIGAGIAGGDWGVISKIIEEELKDLDHTLVVWEKG